MTRSYIANIDGQFQIHKFEPCLVEYNTRLFVPDDTILILDGPVPNGNEWDTVVKLTNQLPESTIIFDNSSNPLNAEQHIKLIESAGFSKPFYLLSGLYNYFKTPPTHPKIKFWPFWAIWMSDPIHPLIDYSQHEFSHKLKQHQLSCLNGTAWNHRKFTYLELASKSYFNEIVFSFGNRDPFDDCISEFNLTESEEQQYSQLSPNVTFSDNGPLDISINHPAFTETYINLITETNCRSSTPMLSEKTFKPIVAGQLFVFIGSPKGIEFLRDIGIDVFDDIVDHSYDNIIDSRHRIQTALAEVDRLMTLDLKSIYSTIKPRLQRNSEFFLSKEFRNQFILNFD